MVLSVYAKSGPGLVIKLLARVGKYKVGTRVGKYKLGARTGKYKFGASAGKYKLGTRVGGQGQGNAKTHLFTLSHPTD